MSHSSWPKMVNPPSLGKDSNARALRGCRSQVSAEERGPTTLSLANRWVKWRNLPREGPRPVPHQPDLPNSTKYLSWGSDSFRPTGWRYHSLRHSLGSLTLFPRNVAMSHLLSITYEAGNLQFVFLDSAIWPAQWFDRCCRNAMVIPDVRARGPPQPGRSVSPTGLETPFPSRAINNGCAHPALRPRAPPSRAAWHFGVDGKKMEREREKDGRFVLPPSFLLSFFQRRSREFHVNVVGL